MIRLEDIRVDDPCGFVGGHENQFDEAALRIGADDEYAQLTVILLLPVANDVRKCMTDDLL